MKSDIQRVVFALLVLPVLVPQTGSRDIAAQRSKEPKVIWQGHSGGFFVHWTSRDVTVAPSKKSSPTLFSAQLLARQGFEQYASALSSDPVAPPIIFGECSYARRFKVLSVVGTIVSLEDQEFSSCEKEAHTESMTRFTAIDFLKAGRVLYSSDEFNVDLASPGKIIKLTDIFSESNVLNALLADSLVMKALSYRKTSQLPKTLSEFMRVFEEEDLSVQTEDGCSYSIPYDLLTRFAFHHVEDNKVAVRLGLPPDVGACRTMHAQLGILLSIPESLSNALSLAEGRREGFLMRDMAAIAGDQATKFRFETRVTRRRRG